MAEHNYGYFPGNQQHVYDVIVAYRYDEIGYQSKFVYFRNIG